MPAENSNVPTKAEIKGQLARMLKSERLSANENPSKFLAFVVRKALRNERITQSVIGLKLFPKKYLQSDISDVRVTAVNLRRVLAAYYANEGKDDLVLISLPTPPRGNKLKLPAGKAYAPLFGYNPRSSAHKEYSRGLIALSETRLLNAEICFERAIRLQPGYAEPQLGLAQMELITPLCPSDISVAHGRRHVRLQHHGGERRLPYAREYIAAALKLNPQLWRAHVLSGVCHSYDYEWEKAEQAFAAALEISESDTRNDPWYLCYLIARTRFDEALAILETKIRESPADASVLTQHAFLLYVLRKFSEAADAFEEATTVDPQHWPAYIGKACAVLAHVGPDSALAALGDIRYSFPQGLFFPGFVVFCLASFGRTEEAQKSFSRFVESGTSSDVDRALAYMSLGRIDEAVNELSQACDDGDPLMLWLHLWPIFDPLREQKRFKALLHRMKLPASS